MRTYGLIGYPLGHSFSRKFFTEKFLRENLQEQYLNFELDDIALLPGIIGAHPELAGLNVTIPYKEKVLPYLGRLDPVSTAIGAVNTIRIIRNQEGILLEGYNSDVYGFSESLKPLLKTFYRKALVLGTGGASKAVTFALDRLGIEWLQVSRNNIGMKCISYDDLDLQTIRQHPIIINTTPLGTFPDTGTYPLIPYNLITQEHLLYDLVYNPAESLFLKYGKEQGAAIKNGYEMLELQALMSYDIWNET
ncbi:MAG TPA: shikimate dehydrogenase [Prolixibacteraceae bacterium]|nr:shikimate dehydrogenase [Prolixibacteraceae bacterium]